MFKTHYLYIYTAAMAFFISACNPFNSSNAPRTINSENVSSEESATLEYFGAKFVTELAELPVCDTIQQGQIFYVIATATFNLCTNREYITLDLTGAQGAQGAKGDSGSPGAQGSQGESGASGANGAVGVDGVDGIESASCSGLSIAEGVEMSCNDIVIDTIRHGQDGTAGDQGTQGTQGEQGLRGDEGMPGDSGVAGTSFFTGDSIPSISIGAEGDTYLDFLTNILFQKDSYGWNVINTHVGILQGNGQYLLRADVTIQDMLGTGASYMDLHKAGIIYADFNAAGISDSLMDGSVLNYTQKDKRSEDSTVYRMVAIGQKYWSTSNVNYLPKVDTVTVGSELSGRENDSMYYVMDYLPEGADSADMIAKAKSTSEYQTYGVLYNYHAAKTACPTGTRLPTKKDWEDLILSVSEFLPEVDSSNAGEWTNIGEVLKSKFDWSTNPGSDPYSFNAKAGGYRSNYDRAFHGLDDATYWWSSEYQIPSYVIYGLRDDSQTLFLDTKLTSDAYSVRCVYYRQLNW